MRKIKIISDGTPRGTKVIDVTSGEVLHGVTGIKWNITTSKLSSVELKMEHIPLKALAEEKEKKSIKKKETSREIIIEEVNQAVVDAMRSDLEKENLMFFHFKRKIAKTSVESLIIMDRRRDDEKLERFWSKWCIYYK